MPNYKAGLACVGRQRSAVARPSRAANPSRRRVVLSLRRQSVMKKSGVRVLVSTAIVCVVAAVMPVVTGAATSAKCSSNQVDIGGTCTSKKEVSEQIVSITQGVMEKEDAKGGPARRRRRRHGRQQGSRDLAGRCAGDAGHEVPAGLDGDPDAHDARAAAAGDGAPQPRRHALEVVPGLPERRSGHVADARERHVGLSRLHPGEPAVPGRAARGALPPVDRRRAAAVRASRSRSSATPARASTTRTPTSSCSAA